jgi:FkbM family methyltransferase
MSVRTIVRRVVLTRLPKPLLRIIRRIHYARLLGSVTEDREVDLKLLRFLVSPGDLVADIGANIGVYTKLLSRYVGARGQVYSIEPVPVTFDVLRANVKALNLLNVEPMNYAISDANGAATMEIPLCEAGGENLHIAKVVPDNCRSTLKRVVVETKTVDSLFSEIPLSFVKCDVEGHELNCINGALGTIRNSKPAWLIEIVGDPDNQTAKACESCKLLTDSGYGIYWFDGTNLTKRRPGDNSVNYWFLAPQHVQRLQKQGVSVVES